MFTFVKCTGPQKANANRLAAVLAGLAVLLSACATANLSEDLEVALVDLRFTEASVLETTGTFKIRLQNQTPESLRVEGAVHKIYLNDKYIGSGVNNETIEIARLAEGMQTVTVHLRNLSMARQIRNIIEARRTDYRLDSQVFVVRADGHKLRLRVSRADALDLKDFQPSPR